MIPRPRRLLPRLFLPHPLFFLLILLLAPHPRLFLSWALCRKRPPGKMRLALRLCRFHLQHRRPWLASFVLFASVTVRILFATVCVRKLFAVRVRIVLVRVALVLHPPFLIPRPRRLLS